MLESDELAQILNISKASLWRFLSRGRLPEPIRFTSQCLRWRRAEIEEWIRNGCPTPDTKREVQYDR